MIRKQVYLTPEIDRALTTLARSKGKNVAETLREILNEELNIKEKNQENPGAVLVRMAANAVKGGPKDLSRNLTSYLYGEKSPNYGKGKKSTDLTKAEITRLDNYLHGKHK